jgi:adenine nucleotide transporter 17
MSATPGEQAVSGALAGMASLGLTYPLLTVISKMQVARGSKESWTAVVQRTVRSDGARGLYAGFAAAEVASALSQFVYYYWYSRLRRRFAARGAGRAAVDLLAGFLAGVATVLATSPLWVVTAEQQTYDRRGSSPAPSRAAEDNGFAAAARRVHARGGALGFWKGLLPSIVLCANPAVQYMVYESACDVARRARARRGAGGPLSAVELFWLGALAKTVATVVTYPLQTVKTRMQAAVGRGKGALHVAADLVREDGPAALFRGLGSKILQSVFTAALLVAFQDRILRRIVELRGADSGL